MTFDEMLNGITDEKLKAQLKDEYEKASSKEGYYSQSDFDRKVNDISQKYISDEKEMEKKIRKKIEEDAKLSAEEKARQIREEADEILKQARRTENRVTALSKCTEAGIPKDVLSDDMMALFVSDDADRTSANIEMFISSYNTTVDNVQKKIMDGTPQPKHNNGGVVTKKEFDAMSTADQIKFKNDHPESFKKFAGGR